MIGTGDRRSHGRFGRGFGRDRRGSVVLIAALAAPVLLMSLALGVEVAHWSVVQLETQRIADMAALAGGEAQAAGATAQQAANAAANVAELNGAVGASVRTWDAATETLSDDHVVVQVTSGVRNPSDAAVRVSIQQNVPLMLAQMFKSATSQNLAATATGEVASTRAWGGPQPCLAALKTAAQGGSGIVYSGSATVSAIGCSVRSNANITETGSGYWNTEGIYAAGSVSLPSWFSPTDVTDNNGNPITPVPNAGTLPDPYATNAAVQQAFTQAAQATNVTSISCPNPNSTWQNPSPCTLPANGSSCSATTGSGTCTLEPGTYGSFNVTSGGPYTFNLQPGMYYFKGNINLTNYTTTNGNGVTIVTTGTFNGANTFNFNVNAPTPAQAALTGGIAGLALAGNTSGSVTVSGDPHVQIGGVMYFPNASFSGQGSTSATGTPSESCFELIAASISLSGYSGYAGNCPNMGATSFGSILKTSSVVMLVQ